MPHLETCSNSEIEEKKTLKNYIYHEKLDLRGQVFPSWALSGYDSSLAWISWVTKRRTQLAGDSAEGLIHILWLHQPLWMCPHGKCSNSAPWFHGCSAGALNTPRIWEIVLIRESWWEHGTKKPKSAQNFLPLRFQNCPTNGSAPS